jgi:hypothetical protein
VLFYRAALPLSSRTLNYAAGIIRRHRGSIGSAWRKLNAGQQALLVLAYLRKGETFAELAAGFGVGTATAWRYVNETVGLLAARAPRLRKAVGDAKKAGYPYVVVDGTLITIDRVAADRPSYSGKHRRHGMNLQVIASPTGDILWVSGALPGTTSSQACGQSLSSCPSELTLDTRLVRHSITSVSVSNSGVSPAKGDGTSGRPAVARRTPRKRSDSSRPREFYAWWRSVGPGELRWD